MKLTQTEYRQQPWIIHNLASDFFLRDVWRLPLKVDEPIEDFINFFLSVDPLQSSPIVKAFFSFRFAVGRILHLDECACPIPFSGETSFAKRLSSTDSGRIVVPNNSFRFFRFVYLNENEALFETSNRTIFALIHLGKKDDEVWLGIHTKSYGLLSDMYMALIKPFRHLIVYPLWLSYLKRQRANSSVATQNESIS